MFVAPPLQKRGLQERQTAPCFCICVCFVHACMHALHVCVFTSSFLHSSSVVVVVVVILQKAVSAFRQLCVRVARHLHATRMGVWLWFRFSLFQSNARVKLSTKTRLLLQTPHMCCASSSTDDVCATQTLTVYRPGASVVWGVWSSSVLSCRMALVRNLACKSICV